MKNTNKKINFMAMLLVIGILPVSIALIISTIISIKTMTNELENDVYEKLNVAAESLANYYEYDIANGTIEYEEDYVDSLVSQNIELTVFEKDTRFMTSIYKEGTNERNVGTKADIDIYNTVRMGNNVQKDGVTIGGELYYVAYRPMYDGNGYFWGMAFAGTPESHVKSAVSSVRNSFIVLSFILIILSVIVTTISSSLIKKPIVDTVNGIKLLSTGTLDIDIKNINSGIKEIQDIVLATNALQENLKESIGSVKSSEKQLSTAVIDVDSKTSKNVESVSQISSAIDEVSTTSQTVSASAINLADKSSDMGKNIDDLLDNVRILTESSNEIKKANTEASEYMKNVLDSSSQSVLAVDNIASDINDTNNAVKEIESAISMIEEIASQTKLLSLNASIEAARAGEQGRGFAVVASNIKELAESSSNNVNKISEIINRIVAIASKTADNAKNVKDIIDKEQKFILDTQKKFQILSDNVDNSIVKITEIETKTKELNQIKQQVNDETESLSAISQELGASAEEVSASCTTVLSGCEDTMTRTEEMKSINETLSEAVSFFK